MAQIAKLTVSGDWLCPSCSFIDRGLANTSVVMAALQITIIKVG